MMEEVGALKAEREVLEQQLKGPVTDISERESQYMLPILPRLNIFFSFLCLAGKFLAGLKEVGDVDEEATSEAHLQSEYGKLKEQVH